MAKRKNIKRRGAVYTITSHGLKELAEMTGQARLIAKTLKRMRKATARQLQKRMGRNFKTKNVASSVIGVYLGRFRRAGLLAAKIPARA